ncbi:MAG TPA: PfkB family carbohydrate kinase [Homoserinimonas sp.]|nr:PfkB family carbohydrate kinase [Homoserinimonas sp.]
MTGRIVVFGDVIDDIVVVPNGPIRADTDTPSSIRHRAGGSAANVASWLGRRGADVDFVGRVAASDVVRHSDVLSRFGVTPHLVGDDDLPTGTIVVIVDGDSRSMLTERGANDQFSADQVTDELLAQARLVHFTGYSIYHGEHQDAIARLFDRAAAKGVTVSVDPASAGSLVDFGASRFLELIAGAGVLLPNLEEGRVLTGLIDPEAVAEALGRRFALVALTMGDSGVIVAQHGRALVRVDAVRAARVDPTGAGDAFSAGFLAEWVRGGDAVAAARAGVAVAAEAVTIVGGRPL